MEETIDLLNWRLDMYKTALKDWQTPDLIRTGGFCWYFLKYHHLSVYSDFESYFPELYQQRLTEESNGMHYPYKADNPIGKSDRVKALISAIELTESKIKELSDGSRV